MNRKLMVAFLAVFCFCKSLTASSVDNWFSYFWHSDKKNITPIKVLIVHDQPGAVLEVNGKYQIFDPFTNSHLSTRFIGKRKFVQALRESLKWGEEFPGIHQIKIVPDEKKTSTIVDGIEYKGNIYIYDIGGTISIINEVDIEDYLKSILASQFDNSLPEEELAAIAIAARTNAYFQAENPKNTYWAVDASKVGYEGSSKLPQNSAMLKAITNTKGMVLEKEGKLFPAEWGSSTGGKNQREKADFSHISLFEAEELAKKGEHAAQILSKAFPNSYIKLINSSMLN